MNQKQMYVGSYTIYAMIKYDMLYHADTYHSCTCKMIQVFSTGLGSHIKDPIILKEIVLVHTTLGLD